MDREVALRFSGGMVDITHRYAHMQDEIFLLELDPPTMLIACRLHFLVDSLHRLLYLPSAKTGSWGDPIYRSTYDCKSHGSHIPPLCHRSRKCNASILLPLRIETNHPRWSLDALRHTEFTPLSPTKVPMLHKQQSQFDIFISYRREGSPEIARLLKREFEQRGYQVFLDVENLGSHHFDEALQKIIETTPHFLLILSPHALPTHSSRGDVFRQEIAHAIRMDRNIIPIRLPDFKFPDRKDLPHDIADIVRYNAVDYSHQFFDATLAKIEEFIKGSMTSPRRSRFPRILAVAISSFVLISVLVWLFWPTPTPQPPSTHGKEWASFFGALPWLNWIVYDPTDYDPFQNKMPSAASIQQDLEVLRRWGFGGLITMTTKGTCKEIPRIAHEVGFNKVIVGVWDLLDKEELANAASVGEHADAYCLGNGMLNKRWNEIELKQAMNGLRGQTQRPVTTTEAIGEYEMNPDLAESCDFLFPDVHANWYEEKGPQEVWNTTMKFARQSAEIAKKTTSGRVLLKMVSYPSGGDAKFTPEKQCEFFRLVMNNRLGNVAIPTNVTFSFLCAFDAVWKTEDQGFLPSEKFTGLFNAQRQPKPVLSAVIWKLR
jgi:exo-beta-1,3-glucanase (GH17 family)